MSDPRYAVGPPPGYRPPPAPPARAHMRAYYAAQARNGIDQAHRDANEGKGARRIWVVITSSYSVDIDHATERGKQAETQLSRGDIAAAIEGLEPVHTEVGFRIDHDGANITLTCEELELRAKQYDAAEAER